MSRQKTENSINKQGFAEELARRIGVEPKQAAVITDIFLDILTDQMSAMEPVYFHGFGTFGTRTSSVPSPGNTGGKNACRPDFRPSRKLAETVAAEIADPSRRSLRRRAVLEEPLGLPAAEKRPPGRPRKIRKEAQAE